ncbi:MAG: deoxyguanosinetriphosphate triphosphohydrolase family protein [Alphaproteobacteria bacterium]
MTDQQNYPFYSRHLSRLATPMVYIKRQGDNQDEMNYFSLTHRSAFQRDRDRIVHAVSFRRLKHKTQVFIAPKGDHYRTRLTHSLEVATLSRSLARLFGLDEDLSEAVALAHDIGHPPFGHVGEQALDDLLKKHGDGFDHNEQALRCLMLFETRYPNFQGLNLTNETLLNIAKHNGPFYVNNETPPPMVQKLARWLGKDALASQAGLEGQLASLCDDIAYNAHDIDDGFRADILTYDDIIQQPALKDIAVEISSSSDDEKMIISSLTRRFINRMMMDVYQQTLANVQTLANPSWQAIIDNETMVASFSPKMADDIKHIKKFLYHKLYKSPALTGQGKSVPNIIISLFRDAYDDFEWCAKYPDKKERLIAIKDYIAGMTDNFALRKYQYITNIPDKDLPFSPIRF